MGNALKNIFLTAALVIGATVATSSVATLSSLLVGSDHIAGDPNSIMFGTYAAIIMGALVGFFFSIVTLFMAAITMPPTLAIIRGVKAPRPLSDILGGGAMGFVCATMLLGLSDEMMRAKGGTSVGADGRLVIEIVAMFGGGILGYLRHFILVRVHGAPAGAALA